MKLLVPVYVHVHNIKLCSSKCLWGSECEVQTSVWYVEAAATTNMIFFSWFLNHSPFLVKNAERKEKNVFMKI